MVDIGHPAGDPAWPSLVTDLLAAEWLPRLRSRDHKGDRGRVVIVGGSAGMSGAARMAGRAAFGAGAGLVHVVAPPDTVAALVQAEPDLQTLAHPLDQAPSPELLDLVGRCDALIIGPGLGREPGRRTLVATLVRAARTAVLDADALVAFQGAADELRALADERPLVLTPHPGEFRTLFPSLAPVRELDPWAAAVDAADASGATLLLKGVPTVVARRGQPPLTVAAGNPGLATGGSGDVLSGLSAPGSPRASRPTSPPPSAPKPSVGPPTSPRGAPRPAPFAPWTWSPRSPTCGGSGSCCGWPRRSPARRSCWSSRSRRWCRGRKGGTAERRIGREARDGKRPTVATPVRTTRMSGPAA